MDGKGKLQSWAQYLKETESAVRILFDGRHQYLNLLNDIKPSVFIAPHSSEEGFCVEFKDWQERNKKAIRRALRKEREYLGYQFSLATLCGSILQIAHMGIALFSKNKSVPPELSSHIKKGSKPARFCIGERIRGVPIGLVIYAGRNQYNHLGEPSLRSPNQQIFDILSTNHCIKGAKGIKDPAFDLRNKTVFSYASNIMSILGWDSYETYITCMKNLLSPRSKRRKG